MAEDAVRLRLVFEDGRMLSKFQKSEGLKRCWLLIHPQQHATMAALASYLHHTFSLRDSCPHGLALSMDGFAFPPFESTCILKDKDIIRVKRKKGPVSDIIKIADESNFLEEDENVQKQPLDTGLTLLANKEFEKDENESDASDEPAGSPWDNNLDVMSNSKRSAKQRERTALKLLANEESECKSESYQTEAEEGECDTIMDASQDKDAVRRNRMSNKRKAPKKLESSKRKKRCSELLEEAEDDAPREQLKSSYDNKAHLRKSKKIQKFSAGKAKARDESNSDIVDRSTAHASILCTQLQGNTTHSADQPDSANGVTKGPSRSARRKKAKRRWLRELSKVEKKEVNRCQTSESEVDRIATDCRQQVNSREAPDNEVKKTATGCQQQDQRWDSGADVVPVIIRPGHIRFESIEEEHVPHPNKVPVETFHWTGITSKRKGQKWGTEKFSSSGNNGYKNCNNEPSEMSAAEEVTMANESSSLDFDKLSPLVSSPKAGDVLAYRLIELSSSWTPEISGFRVGEISSYDSESKNIVLVPVPEYPIVSDNIDEDGSTQPQDASLYKEDGSLEIGFASLVDVRIVKLDNSLPIDPLANGPPPCNQDIGSDAVDTSNNRTDSPVTENGKTNAWDEISKVISAKKAQLSQQDGWGNNASSRRSSWSFRAMRGSALGPTVALLRSSNNL